jgi:peptide/nickel transport system permease protein
MPGDAIDAMMVGLPEEVDRAMLEHSLGLDAPVLVQYVRWLGIAPQGDGGFSGILQGNFGKSWMKGTSVLKLLSKKWPITLELSILGLMVAQLIALPIGITSALRQDKLPDYVGRGFAILLISLPNFWVATMVVVFPSIWWGYMPPIMIKPFIDDPINNLKMFIIPSIVMGMAMSGMTMRITRTMMLEVLRQDYIRTAWAKGLRERVITTRHALKNALIPVITILGFQLPVLVGGTVIIEQIFALPGMGRLLIDATMQRDQPVVSGIMFVFAIVLILINLLVDLSYGYFDPRVRYE